MDLGVFGKQLWGCSSAGTQIGLEEAGEGLLATSVVAMQWQASCWGVTVSLASSVLGTDVLRHLSMPALPPGNKFSEFSALISLQQGIC